MAEQVFPTKGNLLALKKSLTLARLGFELLDRKRNVLIRELMTMVDEAKVLRSTISDNYKQAYAALQRANITLGLVSRVAESIKEENSVNVTYRSVMGCELPTVRIGEADLIPPYGFENTDENLDIAYIAFNNVKTLTAKLAQVDNSVFRLANAIKKTQTRANALKNVVIPRYEENLKYISDSLEEKEREEFSRQKVIKAQKEKKKYRKVNTDK
ncbi:MAG: V-type ATP synthase subunit D [Oscillospiraceae bacterium]|nr:V-type ATP synthase subunit D [Oscillospiraceae bacterium]